ncbi:LysR family transcriptional regulator [Neomegalonema sp.]|uniref:LysR family transcriptional regulator n=1 Tax=Neomegalonema sp. TaxID=2039713 RepID=UPI00260B9F9D|nr:LysR family transcriptional regulator [Neomegalonema sp.]MDD2870042.1 LysR family transcriptional regulator [Neomegalonema sp.]
MIEPRRLKHFAILAETLHFGRAAERLGMTQPPLSQSIQALEAELGARLFQRTRRSVALTPFGESWLPHVRAALEALEALPEAARRLRDGEAGRLALSFVGTATYSVLPSLVRAYAARFPDVEIALTEATSDVQISRLLAGEGHAGLIVAPPSGALPEALAYLPLLSEPLVAAVPESLGDREDPLAPEEAIRAPLILFPRPAAPAFHDLVTGYVRAHGGEAKVAQEATQMQTIVSLVSAGLGLALVPASLRNLARTGVRYRDLRDKAPILETGLVWRRAEAAPTLRGFLEVAREARG